MENLPEEVIFQICSNMEISELMNMVLSGKKYARICGEVLNRRKKEEYIVKYGEGDERLTEMIATLFDSQISDNMYYRFILPPTTLNFDVVTSNSDFQFIFFRGNFAQAIFKIADFINKNIEGEYQGKIHHINLFSEVLYRHKNQQVDVSDFDQVKILFLNCDINVDICIEEFDKLPRIKVL